MNYGNGLMSGLRTLREQRPKYFYLGVLIIVAGIAFSIADSVSYLFLCGFGIAYFALMTKTCHMDEIKQEKEYDVLQKHECQENTRESPDGVNNQYALKKSYNKEKQNKIFVPKNNK